MSLPALKGILAFEAVARLGSIKKAADELNRRGIPTAAGGKWQAVQVIRVRGRLN